MKSINYFDTYLKKIKSVQMILNNSSPKHITAIIGLCLVLFAFYYNRSICLKRKELLEVIIKNQKKGIVEKKFISKNDKAYIKLKYQLPYLENNNEIWKLIQIGDSINHEKNSTIIKIYRKKIIYKIDLNKIYECEKSNLHFISKKWIKP